MAEALVDHRRIFNRGDDLHGAAAVGAVFNTISPEFLTDCTDVTRVDLSLASG